MAYYSKSQIQTNLYTNGKEYILSSTQKEYIGYYYKISTGKYYSGKTPNDNIPVELLPYNIITNENLSNPFLLSQENFEPEKTILALNDAPADDQGNPYPTEFGTFSYSQINPVQPRSIPSFNPTTPTPEETAQGFYTKYFCKKNNELKYIEINKDTFNKLTRKSPEIAWDLYTPVSIVWLINDQTNTNYLTVSRIETTQRWYGFTQYFKSFS